jgi:glucose/arabinose dehydrogenase
MKHWRPSDETVTRRAHFRHIGLRWCFSRLIATIAIVLFPGGWSLPAAILPPGFTETQFGSNVGSSPTAMDFSPDGRLFVCLQGGQLRIIENGVLLATPFVTVPTILDGERGLLGIAFDPNFPTNQFVYVYYTVSTAPIHNRVSRFTANENVAVDGSETVVLELDNLSSATNHNGGAIHFGPDGRLYVAVGENANPSNAQSLDNRLGKLLRINSNGSIPLDNPVNFPGIPSSPSGANRAIWAVGLRNPFTFGFQPGTGRLFINDVGEGTFEEINDGIAGSNYGWSICEGFCSPPNANYRDPLFAYDHSVGCAIVGGAFYNPAISQFPAAYVGKYFFGDLCGGWISGCSIHPITPRATSPQASPDWWI